MYLAKVIDTKHGKILFDALTSRFVQIEDESVLEDEMSYKAFLRDNNFRDINIPCEYDIQYPYTAAELKRLRESKMRSITLALTEQCNLRCTYCGYMRKYLDGEYHLKMMSQETAFKAIDYLMDNSEESDLCNIGFYGGEPLICFELIKRCVAYVKEKYPFRHPTYNIVTNGLLLDDEVADFFIENNIKVNISLDGPTAEFNKYRLDVSGKPTFDRVVKNIQRFYEKDPKYFKESVTYNAVLVNGARHDLFKAWDKVLKTDINLIDLIETDYFAEHRDESDKKLEKEVIKATDYEFVYSNSIKGLKKYYNSFSNGDVGNVIWPGGFCIPGVRKNFVTTDGKIILCEKVNESEEIFDIGDVYNGIDEKKIQRLIDKTLESTKKCRNCWAARYCPLCFKDIVSNSKSFCENARKSVERELEFYIDQVNENNREMLNEVANLSII